MEDSDKTQVSIDPYLYQRFRKRSEDAGFKDVSTYINYILRQVLENLESEEIKEEEYADKVENKVEKSKSMLRKLGYLE